MVNAITSVAAAATAKSLQSCPTLCNPIDGSPPGSPVPGILQARTLEILTFYRNKSSSKREVYSNTILPQETRKTSNGQPNFTPKTTGKRTKKSQN